MLCARLLPRVGLCSRMVRQANPAAPATAAAWPAVAAVHTSAASKQETERLATPPREGEGAVPSLEHPPEENPLFKPYKMGSFHLKHRIVYAPLTRCRAIDTVPRENAITYYSQRASPGGLMLTEATCISERAHGYPHTPGIYRKDQQDGWRPIVKAVHDKGAVFFLQAWHVGRASHNDYQPNGEPPVSASAIPITDGTQVFSLKEGKMVDFPTPRPLDKSEIPGIVEEYRRAARASLDVGFDGVEIHGANGYLIDQFLKDESNKRTDEYGGSIENRCRFALEVCKAVADEIGPEKTGIRLSPFGGFQNASDSHPYALISYLLEELNKLKLVYVHLVEPRAGGNADQDPRGNTLEPFRKVWRNTVIAAGGYKRENAMHALERGHCDLVAFGRLFLANPDLPLRFCVNAPLNHYHRETFYTQGDEGYIDYPRLEDTEFAEEYLKFHVCPDHEP